MRKTLSALLGLLFLVFANVDGQELPTFPYKLSTSDLAKTKYTLEPAIGEYSSDISYLPTNFVCKSNIIDLWNNSDRDSVFTVFNSSLYTGGSFYFSSTREGISIDSSTGEINISGETGKEVVPGVYTVNYEYGNIGTEVFLFAPDNVSVTQGLWKTGPSYDSDLTNSFIVDGKEFIYMANNAQGLYIEMPTPSTGDLRVWGGDDIQIPTSSVWSGGVAEFPPHLLQFFNEEVVPQFKNEKALDARIVHLSTVDYGKIEFDDVFSSKTSTGLGSAINSSEWKGRIHFDNTNGLVTGTNIINPKITQASFSENGNLFYIANHNTSGGNEVSELFFIPTLQVLRMVGDVSKPVNPASSVDLDSDAGNLLNSSAISIVDASGSPLNIQIGDLVIKNPSSYSGSSTFEYSDFKNYIDGFGLNVDKNEGGIWNENWLTYLDPSNANSTVNGSHSLDSNWEFYFTTSKLNTNATNKLEWYTESSVYKAKLDLSDLNDIKLVVHEEYPLNNIKVPISGLGLDQKGCLFFIAGNTQFALVKIFGWGSDCPIPEPISSPFVVVDSVSDIDARVCINDTYDLTSTVPDYLLQPVSFIHPMGEPFDPIPYDSDPVYKPELKNIFDISYTDTNNVAVIKPKEAPIGVYRVWVKQADNGGSNTPNGLFDLQGKCVENDWFYEVRITDLSVDFSYPTDNCSNVLVSPTVTYGNISLGKFAFINADGNRVNSIGLASVNQLTGDITGAESGVSYSVEYLAKDSDNGSIGCADFKKTVIIDINLDITNINPIDIIQSNDVAFCRAEIILVKPILGSSCSTIDSLSINGLTEDLSLENYLFPVGTSIVVYNITDAIGNNILYSYNVIVTDDESPIITNIPDSILVGSSYPDCSSIASWTEPTITDNCNYTIVIEVKDELDDIINVVNGGLFPLGVNTVTYTATDDKGNFTISTFKVTVEDSQPSIIDVTSLPNDVVQCDNNVVMNDVIITESCTVGNISNDFNLNNGANASGAYPIGTTVVTFTVTNYIGDVTDIKTISVTINPELEGEIIGFDVVERGEEFELSFLPESGIVASYSWSILSGNGTIADAESSMSTFKVIAHSEDDIVVQLEITSDGGCTSVFEKTIKVQCTATAEIITPDVLEKGVMSKFKALITGGEVASYSWSVSELASVDNDSQTSAEFQITANEIGSITIDLEVVMMSGCIAKASVTMESECILEVEIDGPSTIDDGFEFDLTSFVSSGKASSYKWSVVSGNATITSGTNEENITAKIEGEATIQLEVTNSVGCTALDQIVLESTGDCKIPNVITPNNDGINDMFVIPCIDTYQNNHIVILDRWGKTVFETSNYNGEWDGSNQNGDYLKGTYFYKLTSSNKSERSGYVVVVR